MKTLRDIQDALLDNTDKKWLEAIHKIISLKEERLRLNQRLEVIETELVSDGLEFLSFMVPDLELTEMSRALDSSTAMLRKSNAAAYRKVMEDFIKEAEASEQEEK